MTHNPTHESLPAHPIRVICECGHSARYTTIDSFESEGGELHYLQQDDLYTALCPSCTTRRPVKVGLFDWDDIGQEFCLALGSFESEYSPLKTGLDSAYDPSRTDFSAVANPVYIARQRFDPICVSCGHRLTSADKKEDGDAPEIGWEYFECPDCSERMHPDSVDHLGMD